MTSSRALLLPLALSAFLLGLAPGLGTAQESAPGDCDDTADNDSDGLTDCDDSDCVTDSACALLDWDGDGAANGIDAFPINFTACGDSDGDTCDDCQNIPNFQFDPCGDNLDTDGDCLCDAGDPDDDNDGISDQEEIDCLSNPTDPSVLPPDNDFDGICDELDDDDDDDGWNDILEFDCTSDPQAKWDPAITPVDLDSDGTCFGLDTCVDVDGDGAVTVSDLLDGILAAFGQACP